MDCFYGTLLRRAESESRSLSVAVAYGGRAGLKRIGSLSVLLLIALPSGQRWALWGAACSCLRSSFSAIAAVSKTPCSGSRGFRTMPGQTPMTAQGPDSHLSCPIHTTFPSIFAYQGLFQQSLIATTVWLFLSPRHRRPT